MEVSSENLRLLLGLKLKTIRQAQSASLKEVAAKAGVSISYLSEIENGKKYPKHEKLLDLARALGVPFDELVSQRVSEPLAPLKSAIRSPVWQQFPFHLFGIEPEDIVSLIAENPHKTGGMLRVIDEVARDYDLRVKHFLFAALRAYQQLHGNHFPEIEAAAVAYRTEHGLTDTDRIDEALLADHLEHHYAYAIDRATLADHPVLDVFRSAFREPSPAGEPATLFLNERLLPHQRAFVMAREIGFQHLRLDDRPTTSSWLRVDRFEPVFNNFKASYFAGALLIPEKPFLRSVERLFSQRRWGPDALLALLDEHGTTPEMLFYRMTELIPHHLGLRNLYFMRFTQREDDGRFHLTKVLNMSPVPLPHGLRRELDYGRRWRTIGGVQALAARSRLADREATDVHVQRARFPEDDATFFEISLSRPLALGAGCSSVTLGFLIDDAFRQRVPFANDPSVPTVEVVYQTGGDRHRARVEALATLGIELG